MLRIDKWEGKGKTQKESQGLTAEYQGPAHHSQREEGAQIAQQSGTQASSYSLLFPAAPAALDFPFRHPSALLKRYLGL